MNVQKYWREGAYARLLELASQKQSFTSDDLVDRMDRYAPNNKAVGTVMIKAQNAGIIEKTEQFIASRRKNQHGSPRRVWKSLIYG
jgi:hypothetical protein